MATYRYLLCDLLTDRRLALLPLSGVSFDRRISRTGSLSGAFSAPTAELVALGKLVHAYAGRSALWVIRDNAIWWGGIPWTVSAQQGARGPVSVNVTAATFDSYAHRRRLYTDATYAGVDQGVIIPDLWRRIQAELHGNIGVVALDQPTGVPRDRIYMASEHAMVGKLIEDLGDVINGPEHTIDVYADGSGNRVKSLRVAAQLGSTDARTVFQRSVRGGGRLVEWEHVSDAVDGGTTFQVRGDTLTGDEAADATQPMMSARVDRTDLLEQGWPLLDVVADREGVTETSTLDGYAQALASEAGGAKPESGYTVEIGNSGWSPNKLGDLVRVKLADAWHDTGTDLTVRPVGCQVTPSEKGRPEQVKLLLADED